MRVAFFSQHAFDEMQSLAFALAYNRPDLTYWLFSLYPAEPSMDKPENLNWVNIPEHRSMLGGLLKISKYRILQSQLKQAQINLLVADDLSCRKIRNTKKLLRINQVLTNREQGVDAKWTNVFAVPISPMATPNHHLTRCIPLYMGGNQHTHLAFGLFKQHETVVSDYFFADVGNCSVDALTQFLKGYSQFKKFQKSSMKLKLGIRIKDRKKWNQLLEHYAWRSEVSLVEEPSEKSHAMDGAYAVCFLHLEAGIHNTILSLMFAKKPVVILEDRFLKELFGKGLIEMTMTEQGVAKQLMQLYKDESEQQERRVWIEQWLNYHQSINILEAWESLMFR
jgi:hypothetical protein